MYISNTEYAAILRIMRNLPRSLAPPHDYTTRERNAVRQAHLLKKRIAKRITANKKKMAIKCYISGAITNLPPDEVRQKFRDAEKRMRDAGMIPVCPLDNGLPASAPYAEHINRDLEMLSECSTILMLPDWRKSAGAMLELTKAIEWGKSIIFDKK